VANPRLSDRAALDAAVELVRRHPERGPELEALVRERGWEEAARIAALDCQSRALRLPPWREKEIPCMASPRGKSRASRLLRRMLRRNISRWDPDPLRAIAEAGELAELMAAPAETAVGPVEPTLVPGSRVPPPAA
jgi:hypothetical protein